MQFVLIRVVAVLIPITKMLQQLTSDVNNQSITIITTITLLNSMSYSRIHALWYILSTCWETMTVLFYQENPCTMLLLTLMRTWWARLHGSASWACWAAAAVTPGTASTVLWAWARLAMAEVLAESTSSRLARPLGVCEAATRRGNRRGAIDRL